MAELNTTQINERLGGVKVTGELIIELGIEPTRREKRAMYWDESLFDGICTAIALHVNRMPLDKIGKAPAEVAPTFDDLFGE